MATERPDHTFKNSVAETAFILAEFPDTPTFQVFVKDQGERVCVGKGESIKDAMEQATENMSPAETGGEPDE